MKLRDILKFLLKPMFIVIKSPAKGGQITVIDSSRTYRHAKKVALSHADSYILIGFKASR